MNLPKRHHYVPEMLQKNFVDDEAKLWAFDSRNRTKGVWRGTHENLFLEGHLYSHVNADGTKDATLETWFSELEGVAATVVQKIIATARRGHYPNLTKTERQIWDFFFYQQWRRVPDLFASLMTAEQHRDEVERLLNELEGQGRRLSNQERSDLLNPASLKRMRRNLRVATLKTGSDNVLHVIGARGLAIGRTDSSKKFFVLGSRPVVKLNPPGITDLSDVRVEAWLPIASDIIVGVGLYDRDEILVPFNTKQTRNQNEASSKQSSQIVGRSKALVESLAPYVGTKVRFTPVVTVGMVDA
ncbi:hypothetical protein J2855_003948 [Agrobacterium tumefaciens]|nr:DUF4238 domain-containing protein [Agrobacterium tumefaciens]MBP2510295.1 hypothetical protein [Agrobacterium tumefaciens]MBP2519126.1 hypothetical protein [Agrobacterium tumefaciens]MBP2577148.1 hypothetical protein [Agrobacterium tumefaciens]MBP2596483.1 hypothetical protein [Agrobacterium tumefaciens]MDP9857700.1 hypothetical protein [Agrobacterium tumefaciens]